MNSSLSANVKSFGALQIIAIQSANKMHAAAEQRKKDDQVLQENIKKQVAEEQAAFKQRQLDIKALIAQKTFAAKQEIEKNKEAARAAKEKAETEKREYDALIKKQEEYADRLGKAFVSKLGAFEIRQLKKQWSAAIEYASSYYDKMNEIRVVTGKTEQDAERIGASYRKLAKELSVTSTELSEAAVTFYRQG